MRSGSPAKVQRSPWAVWSWLACAALCAAVASWAWLGAPVRTANLAVLMLIGAAACLLAFLVLRTERLILHADRIERIGLLGKVVRRRDEVTGYRAVEGQAIVFGPPGGWRMGIPAHAFKNAAWRAWLESCRNLNADEINAALDEAERDPILGHDVEDRRRTVDRRHLVMRALAWAAIALFAWTVVFPRPFALPVYLCCAAPIVAITLAALKKDVFSIFPRNPVATRVDLSVLVLVGGAPAILAMRIPLVDWQEPLMTAVVVATVLTMLAMRLAVEPGSRHWVAGLLLGFATLANAWGGAVVLNQALDVRPPMLVSAEVLGTNGNRSEPAMDVEIGGPHPARVDGVRVSRATNEAHHGGAPICAGVYPGRFGWRSIRLVKCGALVRLPQSPRP